MLSLSIESEAVPPRSIRIEQFPGRIGKQRDCAVVLASWRVARVHAEVHVIDRGFKLVDLGSIGGTWINGERIVEYGPLAEGDAIVIAGFTLRVEAIAQAGAAGESGEARDRPVPELPSSQELEWRRLLHRRLLQSIDLRRREIRNMTSIQLRQEARELLGPIFEEIGPLPESIEKEALLAAVLDEAIGLGPLEQLLGDPGISEIMVNAADEVYIERNGRIERSRVAFTGPQAVRSIIDRIVAPVGRRVDEASPMVDARLPDGSRVNAILPPLAIKGPALTIRRFNRTLLRPDDLIRLRSATPAVMAFLSVCVRHRRNIVISGGTGSGKTTLLNVLANLVPAHERIVTIEDAAELRLNHPHLVSLEARPPNAEERGEVTIRDLVRNALRMRPDRIIVGECRGGEALDMLQAMNTGHDGSLTTLHANSPRDVVSRLETMVLMAGVEIPLQAIREQIASALDIVVQQARLADGTRCITEVVELTGVEGSRVLMQPLFAATGSARTAGIGVLTCAPCGTIPQFYESLRNAGVEPDLSLFDRTPPPNREIS